jgi:vitamin B12 transport system substrate-binding protein
VSVITSRFIGLLLFGLIGLYANQSQAKIDSDDTLQKLRIIALAPHIVESLYAIGAGDQIIGTTTHADYPKSAEDILRVGNYARLQIEKIIQLKPDVIIAWKTGNPTDD